ncbi:uncharacterized protein LOC100208052 isoform X1 [Hydra vulgaris]|uniref:uncharacterized protein LOC100208052 isoform X1 n=2 Tax=Hydra vulgaris TaxID=6087 RepID=UPI001F5FE38C|nr:uncharacterized protein LOC100208052 isoform X1 [Hydra vulgaris]
MNNFSYTPLGNNSYTDHEISTIARLLGNGSYSTDNNFSTPLTNSSNNTLYNHYLNKSDKNHVLIIECVALAGIYVMLTGYKYIRFALFASGFAIAFALFYVVSPWFIHFKYCCDKEHFKVNHPLLTYDRAHLIISCVVGILFGLLVSWLYRLGIFFLGKCLGALITIVALHTTSLHQYFNSNISITILLTVSGFIFGILTWKFEKPLMILATSFIGCFAALCGVDIFLQSGFSMVVLSIILFLRDAVLVTIKSTKHIEETTLPKLHFKSDKGENETILLMSWLFISLGAAIFQFRVTAANETQGGKLCPCLNCICPCCQLFDVKKETK